MIHVPNAVETHVQVETRLIIKRSENYSAKLQLTFLAINFFHSTQTKYALNEY
jgi:hypothetical protein